MPVDLIEFMILTPLPGSEDHQKMAAAGEYMDPDLNKCDPSHVVARHPTLSQDAWQDVHSKAWEAFYTPEHFETVMRRAEAVGLGISEHFKELIFRAIHRQEGIHRKIDGKLVRADQGGIADARPPLRWNASACTSWWKGWPRRSPANT